MFLFTASPSGLICQTSFSLTLMLLHQWSRSFLSWCSSWWFLKGFSVFILPDVDYDIITRKILSRRLRAKTPLCNNCSLIIAPDIDWSKVIYFIAIYSMNHIYFLSRLFCTKSRQCNCCWSIYASQKQALVSPKPHFAEEKFDFTKVLYFLLRILWFGKLFNHYRIHFLLYWNNAFLRETKFVYHREKLKSGRYNIS